uniref:Uncharacterized protein n=1 Tax=Eptatretus burgeri TaxID=7764 RepID=A0A8C4R2A2_EPTBU
MDVDECKGNNDCHSNATCSNTDGGHNCTCKGGFTGNGLVCVDVDECEKGINDCDPNTTLCVNGIGNYLCECRTGYEINAAGKCEDIDECKLGTSNCRGKNEICTNTIGLYQCDCENGNDRINSSCVETTVSVATSATPGTSATSGFVVPTSADTTPSSGSSTTHLFPTTSTPTDITTTVSKPTTDTTPSSGSSTTHLFPTTSTPTDITTTVSKPTTGNCNVQKCQENCTLMNSCQNGGTCSCDSTCTITCNCGSAYKGSRCELGADTFSPEASKDRVKKKVNLKMTATNEIYVQEMKNESSTKYKEFVKKFKSMIIPSLKSVSPYFSKLVILKLTNGSVKVDSEAQYDYSLNKTLITYYEASLVTDILKAINQSVSNGSLEFKPLTVDSVTSNETLTSEELLGLYTCNSSMEGYVTTWVGDTLQCSSPCSNSDVCSNHGNCTHHIDGASCNCESGYKRENLTCEYIIEDTTPSSGSSTTHLIPPIDWYH